MVDCLLTFLLCSDMMHRVFRSSVGMLLLVAFCSAFFACQPSNPSPPPVIGSDSTTTPSIDTLTFETLTGLPVTLVVRMASTPIYEAPRLNAPVLQTALEGDSLPFANRMTTQRIPQTLQGLSYEEPWLRVLLAENQLGWVYGGAVRFDAYRQPALTQALLYPRAERLFGASLTRQLGIYAQEWQASRTLPGFRTLYSRAQLLKDSLEAQMTAYVQRTPEVVPDFFWLNDLLPGLLVHYLPKEERYYLFKELAAWRRVAFQTAKEEDDKFVEVLLSAWPSDSIEYRYYGWQLPVDSLGLSSLLGSGIHLQVLDRLALTLDSNAYFKEELKGLREAVLYDVSTSDAYWMPLPAVLSELDSILGRSYPFLTSGDLVALQTKRQLLESPEKNRIVVNLFEGQ